MPDERLDLPLIVALPPLQVSTTHVACGSLFGISLLRGGESNGRQILQILLAWGVTLPLAAFWRSRST